MSQLGDELMRVSSGRGFDDVRFADVIHAQGYVLPDRAAEEHWLLTYHPWK